MPSVRFYIERRRDSQGRIRTHNVPILLYFSFNGKRLQLSTGERVDAVDWDSGQQRVREEAMGSRQLNRYLDSLAGEVMDIYRKARASGIEPGRDYIREQLKYRRRKENIDFFDVLMRFIDENHSRWSIHTFRKIRTAYNHLRSFAAAEGISIEFDRIDRDFLDRYVRFFRIKYNHSNNSIAKNIDVLKWFLNWATERGYNRSLLYRDYIFPWDAKPRVSPESLVLGWEELMQLYRYEPSSRNLKEVRDIFCFMCFSGIKLSRVYRITKTNAFSDHVRMPGKRETGHYNIPLNKQAAKILETYRETDRYGTALFPNYPNPYFNRLLKRLAREAGINRFVDIEILAGEERATRQVPKYEVLSSRVAVNTFLFNGLRLGVSAEVLAYVIDQKTMKAVERIRPLLENMAFGDIRKFDMSGD